MKKLTDAYADGFLVSENHQGQYQISTTRAVSFEEMMAVTSFISKETLKQSDYLLGSDDAVNYVQGALQSKPYEVFIVVLLDAQHRVIKYQEVFRGTVDSSVVYPAEIVRLALLAGASSVLIGHNHPSGVLEPSSADLSVTKRIRSALNLVDVRLLDHIIVSTTGSLSFAKKGLL